MNRRLPIVLALLLLLSACAAPAQADGLKLCFPAAPPDMDGARPSAQAVSWQALPSDRDATVDSLMQALLAGPLQDGAIDPFPPDTQLLGWSLDDGLLHLDLSAPYGELTGVELTLADFCITLTLCQLEQVDRIHITAGGSEVPQRAHQILSPEDVIFSGAEEEPRQVTAVLYFPRAMGKGLGFETRELTLTEGDDFYLTIAQDLLAGPQDPDLHSILPEGVQLLGASVDDGICYVNFSTEFLSAAPQSEAEQNLLLYSVVDTMGNLSAVTAVQLLVDGELVPQFGGQETGLPLEPDFGLLTIG